MLFTSYTFIAFISILFIVYYLIPGRYQWMLLLGASYLFYFMASPKYLIYISATTISTFIAGYFIDRMSGEQSRHLELHKGELSKEEKKDYKASVKTRQRRWLVACLLLNFGILAVIKYTNFTIANVNFFLDMAGSDGRLSFVALMLPMGISFYTFQTMGYIIDVYRGKAPAEKNVFRLALFVSFFPQLVQGPISRYDDLSKTLYDSHKPDARNISFGLQRILWGFFKKLVIADRILVAVNTIIKSPDDYQGAFVLVGMLFYALQLYADFTGGIDITIGIAEVLGIRIKENFNAPFMAKSITDYWRRWHISMGTWFKDYLFYPISVSRPMLNLSRSSRKLLGDSVGKRVPVYIATIIVWFATGIWHGSSWNFVVWGLMNGLVIILSQECEPFYARFHNRFKVKDRTWYAAFSVVRTVLLMSTLRMFDCYRDVPLTFRMFFSMFTRFNYARLFDFQVMKFGLAGYDYIVLAAGLAVLIASGIHRDRGEFRERLAARPAIWTYAVFCTMLIAVILLGAYGTGYDASQFIYNQF
ncbi:MAG: MBOAT family O-acyltransferase [Saccharofermentanales bacterium]